MRWTRLVYWTWVMGGMFALGCGDVGEVVTVDAIVSVSEPGTGYFRTVLLVDATGANSAIATLRSVDSELLKEFRPGDLTLLPIEAGRLELEGDSGESESHALFKEVTIELNDEILAEGVIGLEVVEPNPPSYRAPLKWRYEYSRFDCVDITRAAYWNRVYTAVAYRSTSADVWHPLVSHRALNRNETLTRCAEGSHLLKVGTYARRAGHYTLHFWN